MGFGKLVRAEPVWDIREYFRATGNMMLSGALLLTLMVFQNRGIELAFWQVALAYLSAGATGLQGLWGFWRFTATSTKPATAATLAIATTFSALLFGGIFGYMAVRVLGKWMA